tara:strand:- start:900 stop:1163 length:264 start_codon:yes stop_codon:yes gene_type:complete
VKETDDGKTIDGQDAGAIPATSTNSREMYQGIFKFAKAMNEYYYTPSEWSRQGMWGPLPDERNTELRGVKQDRLTDENLQEDLDTKT